MNIVMMTNTYKPFVGGVPRSIETFTDEYRKQGNRVLIIAPEFENMPEAEPHVLRVPAIRNFNGTDFSVSLPIPGGLSQTLETFEPDIIHTHHPFLLGDTAYRAAEKYNLPLVFTFHTLYERYTHYVPGDSEAVKHLVIALSAEYANLCDAVFAPSESIATLLVERGVKTPIDVIPTGIDVTRFSSGERRRFREARNIGSDAFVIGFVSRIAPEKNVDFLADAVISFLKKEPHAHFLLLGTGPSKGNLEESFTEQGVADRFHPEGILQGQELIDAYHAMDVFAFASKTETQGIVLTEAMAAGVPVVALDASGVRDVVDDSSNGRLLYSENREEFTSALRWVSQLSDERRTALKQGALQTADKFSKERCAIRALEKYASLLEMRRLATEKLENTPWDEIRRRIKAEWDLAVEKAKATGNIITKSLAIDEDID